MTKGELGEEFVNQKTYKSLLKYWCYPSPKDEKGNKKEICDLLVLFKNTCIIISVKNYTFKGNYDRYNRNTIDKAIKQISGAERKLFHPNKDTYIKHPDRDIEKFSKKSYKKKFRIIVNLGEGLDIYSPSSKTTNGDFITIFNKDTFESILEVLDTITDFTEYLEARENLLKTESMSQWLGAEKDLLAIYIRGDKKFPPEFYKDGYSMVIIDFNDEWNKLKAEDNKMLGGKKKLDEVSYFLDELAEKKLTTVFQGDLLAQEFLSLNRFDRRIFSKLFFDFFNIHKMKMKLASAHRYFELKEFGVVFFYYSPDLVDSSYPDDGLESAMIGYGMKTNFKMKKVLGLGTTAGMEQFKFKFINFNKPLPKENLDYAKKFIKKYGWFKNVQETPHSENEFPH